ncbi:chromosomal replication initiator protein DnaA [Rapidithrix thailandica]|uniref:Chromosomal replication initiator protein DnaA n=1 Tax=Rapidithrix thailandica TaxID=413964 RepID=A0AAW9RPX7_9BACT
MLKDCATVWNNCLEVIRQEVPVQSFKTLFEPIKPIKLQNNILTLEVPSPYFYEWLEEHYVHILKKAIDQELGPEGKLEYSIVVDRGNAKQEPFTLKVRNSSTPKNNTVVNTQPVQQEKPQQRPQQQQQKQRKFEREQRPAFRSPFEIPQVDPLYQESNINPNYVFDTFIEGDCNRLARSAGLAIAKKPGVTAFNPFVVYGGVGLGKTHLAQAIGNDIKTSYPDKFVLYVSSEQFTQQFIEALKNNNVQEFTNFYLMVDVLIVDDIQFLAGKEKTQENFFHIFNRLHQNNKQIIMTSDCPPRSLQGLQERLLSRFKWGLTADVQKPDFETRIAIVKTKMESEGVIVPEDVVEYISYNVQSNIRELEGVLISLIANASFMRKEIDLELAKTTLLNIVRNTDKEITIDFIQQIVADYFGITIEQLVSKTRKKDIAMARQIAMYFSQQYTKTPLKSIGNQFGGRDHSTVVHASKTITKKSSSDATISQTIDNLLKRMDIK